MKIYDLSVTIEEGMWYYGTPYVPYETENLATQKDNGYITNKHILTSHTGTHLENAAHWWADADGVEKMDLESIIGHCIVLKFPVNEQHFKPYKWKC